MDINSSSKEEIKLLIICHLTNSISDNDLKKLKEWIGQSDANRNYFNSIKNTWTLAGKKNLSDSEKEHEWVKFNKKLTRAKEEETSDKKKIPIVKIIRIAASWIVFLIIGAGGMWMWNNDIEPLTTARPIEISVPLGARSKIKMPDNTIVWLNAGTTITYSEDYGNETRTINLVGEAYFDVAKDKDHPFVVKTSEIEIRALGTKFNVKSYPEENVISAILEEGAIHVEIPKKNRKNNNEQIILEPNEKLIYIKESDKHQTNNAKKEILHEIQPLETQKIKLENACVMENIQTTLYTSWKDQRWIIESKQLSDLSPLLERRYNIRIIFLDDESKHYKFSGTITNETVDQIFNAVQLTAPINFSISKDTIKLSINKNLQKEIERISTSNN